MENNISKNVLIQYLEDVLYLEESCLQQERLYERLHADASEYSNENDPAVQLTLGPSSNGKPCFIIAGALAVCSMVVIVSAIITHRYELLLLLAVFVWGIYKCSIKGIELNKKYSIDLERFHQSQQAQKEQEERWERNFKIHAYYNNQLLCIRNKYIESRQLLNELYDTNIIYPNPKYRGLIPVSEFCDYIKSGACDNMPEAYNKYDVLSRMDKISVQLDRIIADLDAIKTQQYSLYCVLRSVQITNEKILGSIHFYGEQLYQEINRQNELVKNMGDALNYVNNNASKIIQNTDLINRNIELQRKEDEFRYRMKAIYGVR